jgi:hypothetical protein
MKTWSGHTLLCPVCKKELITKREYRLETLGEHVGNPNGEVAMKPAWQCPDGKCPTRLHNIMWDDIEGGTYFIGKYPSPEERKAIPFIDGNDAPFGSFDRGEHAANAANKKANTQICTFPKWFPGILSGMEVWWNWVYHADYDGKITGRSFGLQWIKIDGPHRLVHMWGLRMLKFSIRGALRAWWGCIKNPESTWYLNELKQDAKKIDEWRDPEWWRIWSGYFAKFLLWTLSRKKSLTMATEKSKVLA